MRKYFSFLLAVLFLIIPLGGCSVAIEEDVWDGSVADSFACGNGTEKDPFVIEKASQLAFLAQEVGRGTTYAGQYFVLEKDIDLNGIEWTPIGTEKSPFKGNFNGKNHWLRNVKLTKADEYTAVYSHGSFNQGRMGLFGSCENVEICNIKIENASLSLQDVETYDQFYAGALVGFLTATTNCRLSNVKLSNTTVSCVREDLSKEAAVANSMWIGGVIGYADIKSSASFTMEKIQSQADISFAESNTSNNNIGGIVGTVGNRGLFSGSDFASYLNVEWPLEIRSSHVGAFNISNDPETAVKLSNGFSEVKVNSSLVELPGYYIHKANAMIGIAYQGKRVSDSKEAQFDFHNLFGYVKPAGEKTVFSLYEMPEHCDFEETNCKGCETLLENHGFDNKIWDLNDLSRPTLR